MRPLIRPFGPHAWLVEPREEESRDWVQRQWQILRRHPRPGVQDIVPGARSILVVVDPEGNGVSDQDMAGWLGEEEGPSGQSTAGSGDRLLDEPRRPILGIPVVYDGPDLAGVAERTGLSAEEVVARHSAATYRVDFLGFSPGFAYLSGGDPGLAVPRRPIPRSRVEAGSVGLAGAFSAIYPSAGPGGWQIIGRSDVELFDARRRPPSRLAPGDEVRLRAVRRLSPSTSAQDGGPATHRVAHEAGLAALEVLRPGPLSLFEDLGRVGWAHLGVPRAGPADRASLRRANFLIGNPADSAALECTGEGPELRVLRPLLLAISGARGPVELDRESIRPDTAFLAPAGSVLRVGRFTVGLRGYLAVAGGFTPPAVLGSRSRDTLGGLGPEPLAAGDLLTVGLGPPAARGGRLPPGTSLVRPGDRVELPIQPGPDELAPSAWSRLLAATWTVSPDSDRTGARLDGEPLPAGRPDAGLVPSRGMVAGAVQVPPGGRPIVLLANHASTGGYPVPAVLHPPAVDRLGQCPPGTRVRFVTA